MTRQPQYNVVAWIFKIGVGAVLTILTLFTTTVWSHEGRIRVLETQFDYIAKTLDGIKDSIKESKNVCR